MSMYQKFKTDKELEKAGVVLDYGDFRVTIARAGGANKRFAKTLERKSKPYTRAIRTETMENDQALNLIQETYSESVVLNWETKVDNKWAVGIENPNGGKLLPPTPENILTTFKELPDLFADIQEQAGRMTIFREEIREDNSKN